MVKKKTNKGKVKIGELKIEKETIQDLDSDEMSKVKGGDGGATFFCNQSIACGPSLLGTCAGKTCGKKCRP
jgi:natural product precursor